MYNRPTQDREDVPAMTPKSTPLHALSNAVVFFIRSLYNTSPMSLPVWVTVGLKGLTEIMPSIDSAKCILVIGATAGIGRALAIALNDLPSKPVIIGAGRRLERLEELKSIKSKDGKALHAKQVDISADRKTLKTFVDGIINDYPEVGFKSFGASTQTRSQIVRSAGRRHLCGWHPETVVILQCQKTSRSGRC